MTESTGFGAAAAAQAEVAAPSATATDNHTAFVRALGVLPGGVSSPVRVNAMPTSARRVNVSDP